MATKLTRPITRIIECQGCNRGLIIKLSDDQLYLRPTGRREAQALRISLDKLVSKFTGQTEGLALKRFLR